jgi:hypothetical protein
MTRIVLGDDRMVGDKGGGRGLIFGFLNDWGTLKRHHGG